MKKIRFLLCLITMIFLASNSWSQYNDFGIWNKYTFKKDLPKGFDLGLDLQLRTNENTTEIATTFFDLSLKYKLHDRVKIVGNYRFGNRRELEDYYDLRQRFALDLNVDAEVKKLDLKYRMRIQTGSSNLNNPEDRVDRNTTWRHKISMDHKIIKKTRAWTSFEYFTAFDQGFLIPSDWRWKIGIDRKISKRQVLSLGYMIQREIDSDNPVTDNVFLVSYEWELKKKKKKKKKKAKANPIP